MRDPGPVGSHVVHERRALQEIRKHEMPAMRRADRGSLAWVGRVERPDAFRALVADWLDRMRAEQARDGRVPRR